MGLTRGISVSVIEKTYQGRSIWHFPKSTDNSIRSSYGMTNSSSLITGIIGNIKPIDRVERSDLTHIDRRNRKSRSLTTFCKYNVFSESSGHRSRDQRVRTPTAHCVQAAA